MATKSDKFVLAAFVLIAGFAWSVLILRGITADERRAYELSELCGPHEYFIAWDAQTDRMLAISCEELNIDITGRPIIAP